MLSDNQVLSRPQIGHVQLQQHRTTVEYTVARQRTSVGFKLAVRGDSVAGGLVVPLPCTAYFGKLAILFGCSLPQGLVHLYSYHSLASLRNYLARTRRAH